MCLYRRLPRRTADFDRRATRRSSGPRKVPAFLYFSLRVSMTLLGDASRQGFLISTRDIEDEMSDAAYAGNL